MLNQRHRSSFAHSINWARSPRALPDEARRPRHAGEDLRLRAEEGVPDQRRERSRRDRKVELVLPLPLGGHFGEKVAPARYRVAPAGREPPRRRARSPTAPRESARSPCEVLAEVRAHAVRHFVASGSGEAYSALPLEQAPSHAPGPQRGAAAWCGSGNGRARAAHRPGPQSPRRRLRVPVPREGIARRVEDQHPGVVTTGAAEVEPFGSA